MQLSKPPLDYDNTTMMPMAASFSDHKNENEHFALVYQEKHWDTGMQFY